MEPFLKWAGGKRWLVRQYAGLFTVPFKRYLEPFLGSGAVFFHLAPRMAILSDVNLALIDAYRAIQQDWKRLVRNLAVHQAHHSKAYYYKIRAENGGSLFERAARLIYLNRTCWNGLYRLNRKGQFNVPIGTRETVIRETDDFAGIAKMLGRAKLQCCDFRQTVAVARAGDLLFVDPPYTVKHNQNNFVKYNEVLFNWQDQLSLAEELKGAIRRGACVILTNAYHASLCKLYDGLGRIRAVDRQSAIAADRAGRGRYEEMLFVANLPD